MIQKYTLTMSALLNLTFALEGMKSKEIFFSGGNGTYESKKNRLEPIERALINFYIKKVGTEKIVQQLDKARPDEDIPHPNDWRSYRLIRRTPSLTFTLYFLQNIEEAKNKGKLFCDDQKLNEIIFNKIEENEKNDGYISDHIDTEYDDNSIITTCPNNFIGKDLKIQYWHKKNLQNQQYVKCNCSFDYEDKEAIQELVENINKNK